MSDGLLPMTLDIVRGTTMVNVPAEGEPNHRIIGFKVHISKLGEVGLSEPLASLYEIKQIVNAFPALEKAREALAQIDALVIRADTEATTTQGRAHLLRALRQAQATACEALSLLGCSNGGDG